MRVFVATAKKPRAARWRGVLEAISAEHSEVSELSLLAKVLRSDEAALVLIDLYLLDRPGSASAFNALRTKFPRLDLVVFGDEAAIFGEGMGRALELGASDFLHDGLMDFELERYIKERLSRLEGGESSEDLKSPDGKLSADRNAHAVRVREKGGWREIESFTPKEFATLCLLLQRGGEVVSRRELMESVWGKRAGKVNLEAVDKQVASIRKKLGSHGKSIKTRRGIGYLFG